MAKSNPRPPKSALTPPQECPKSGQECCKSTPRASQERTKRLPEHLKSVYTDFGTFLVMILDMRFKLLFGTMLENIY